MLVALLESSEFDSCSLSDRPEQGGRSELNICPRRRYLTALRHRRGGKSAASRNGFHRRGKKKTRHL